jgi:hypothetical protein
MPDVQIDRLIPIVTGIQLRAELGDRPLAYHVEREVREFLDAHLPKRHPGELPLLAPVVVSDVFYLNNDELQTRPTISIGGPGMNALTATLVEELPTARAIDETLVIQMSLDVAAAADSDADALRCVVWGMNHHDTGRAVETFIAKGYLAAFLSGVMARERGETPP